jgi:hypothetical protein
MSLSTSNPGPMQEFPAKLVVKGVREPLAVCHPRPQASGRDFLFRGEERG